MTELISAFYDLLGPSVSPRVEESDIHQHVDEIFQVCMNINLK